LRDDPGLHILRTDLAHLNYEVELRHHTNSHFSAAQTPLPARLPPLEVCERLSVLYFDNLEHCFRILHWGHFKVQLRKLFTEGEQVCDFGFYPQLVGVLALAVILGTTDDCAVAATYATMRSTEAIKLLQEFTQHVNATQKYTLPALQVKTLLMTLQWFHSDSMDTLFHSCGEILRDAMVMKMDRDPDSLPNVSAFEGELRRRCWMTILEFNLMLSLLGKFPVMVPAYSTKPPLNINDEDMLESMAALPASRPTTEWTDSLCQFLLAQSFPCRVKACRAVETGMSPNLEQILSHTRYLEEVLQQLPAPLRFNYLGDKASKTPPRLMARMEFDISIRRPLMHLYERCASNSSAFQAEIRAGLLQSCYMLLNYQDLFDPNFSELDVPRPQGYWDFFYHCYRCELGQAIFGLCLEIYLISLDEQQSVITKSDHRPAPTTPSTEPGKTPCYSIPTLTTSVRDTLEPMTRRLPYRASSVKDIVYYNIILTSLQNREPSQDLSVMIVDRLKEVVNECHAVMTQVHTTKTSPLNGEPPRQPESASIATIFDPLWEDFPMLDILEPLTFTGG
jgi:hypothetical protein